MRNRLRGRNLVTSPHRVQKMHRDRSLNPSRRSLNRVHNPSLGMRHSLSHGRRSLNPGMKRNLSLVRSLNRVPRRSPDRNLINRASPGSSLGHNRTRGRADIPLRNPLMTGLHPSSTIMANTRMVSRRSEEPCRRNS